MLVANLCHSCPKDGIFVLICYLILFMKKSRNSSSYYGKKHKFRPPIRKDFVKRVDDEQTCDSSKFTRVEVEIFGGNLILLPAADQTFTCRIQWNHEEKANQRIMPRVSYEGEVIKVSQEQGLSSFFKYRQRNAYVIALTIPASLMIDVKMKAGQIYVDQVKTPVLSLKMKVGAIDGFVLAQNAYVSLGVGSIKLHSLQGSAVMRVKLGDIETTFDRIGERDHVLLSATAGDVKVLFPRHTLTSHEPVRKNGKIANQVGAHVRIHAGIWGDAYAESR